MRRYLVADIKMMLRLPFSIIFSLAFPLLMLFILMTSIGNIEIANGYKFIDKMYFISLGLGLLPTTIQTFPSFIAGNIEKDYVKRLKYWNVKYIYILFSDLIVHMILSLVSLVVNLIFAYMFYDLTIPDFAHFMAFLLQYFYLLITLMCFGAIMVLVLKKVNISYIVGLVLTFVLYFFTGAFGNFSNLPSGVQKVGNIFSLKVFMHEMNQVFYGEKYFVDDFIIKNTIWFFVIMFILAIIIVFMLYKRNFIFKERKKCLT